MKAHTDADVQAATAAIVSSPNGPWTTLPGPTSIAPDFARAVLEAVAPVIAARALGDAAEAVRTIRESGAEGPYAHGFERWLLDRAAEYEHVTT